MTNEILTSAEIDAAGEIFNIGMGSAANTISQVLDKPVSITKISASQSEISKLDLKNYDRGLWTETDYTGGLSGNSGIVFAAKDIQAILNVLMMTDTEVGADFEFDDMALSTIQEIFNMMMQTCSQTMNEFLNCTSLLTLSAKSFQGDNAAVELGLTPTSNVMFMEFQMDVSGVTSAKFIYLFTPDLMTSMIKLLSEMGMLPEEPVAAPIQNAESISVPNAENIQNIPEQNVSIPPVQNVSPPVQSVPVQNMPLPDPNLQQYPQYPYYDPALYYQHLPNQYSLPMPYGEDVPEVKVQKPEFPDFGKDNDQIVPYAFSKENYDNLMKVDLRVAAELGKVKCKMKEIMALKVGTVLDLNRSAGAPVEIVANKQSVGTGDIVVIGDNFYVRVIEIHNDLKPKRTKR
jgi:flagellar motor switch protein FliN/FliY